MERPDRHKEMRSGDFPRRRRGRKVGRMLDEDSRDVARAGNHADVGRVLVALVVLALLAWPDRAPESSATAARPAAVLSR